MSAASESTVILTDIVLRCASGTNHNFAEGSLLYLEAIIDEKNVKLGPLAIESSSSLKVPGNFQGPAGVSQWRIVALLERSGQESEQIGCVELDSDHLLSISRNQNNKLVQELVTTGDTLLEIVATCVSLPPDKSDSWAAHLEGETRQEIISPSVLNIEFEQALRLPDNNPAKSIDLLRIGVRFRTCYRRSGDETDLNQAISAFEVSITHLPDGHELQEMGLRLLGNSLWLRHQQSPSSADVDRAIFMLELSTIVSEEGNTDSSAHAILGDAFEYRFERTGDLVDIDKAISNQNVVVRLTPDGHADKPGCLNNLGISFLRRFKRTGDLGDIEKAISNQNDAVRLTPDGHADKPMYLNNLGTSFHRRFKRTGDLGDIDKAISNQNVVLRLTPDGHADKPGCLNNLGNSFQSRFERTGDLGDIEKAISYKNDAVRVTPDGHADKPGRLNNLGNAFFRRFERTGDLSDIEKAISNQNDAVRITPDGHADKPMYLNNLGISFLRRFDRTGDLSDIEKAISNQNDAVWLTPDGHADKPGCLNNLGISFQSRFERTGDLGDIDKAISNKNDAVRLTPDGHAAKPGRLNNLGNSFFRRFDRTGDLVDIDKAISNQNDAVRLTRDGHAAKPGHLNNLGTSFQSRFEQTGDLSDIEKAISNQNEAVRLTPDRHPDKPGYFNNLGISFRNRFEQTGDLSDIDKAISNINDAVQLTPVGHADKPMYLNNLGNSFLCRSEQTGDLGDIEKAISNQYDAVRLTPDGHADQPMYLNNLGNSFFHRFDRTGDLSDIDKAISNINDAVWLTPDGHAAKPRRLNNLGNSFLRRFEQTGDLGYRRKALEQFKHSAILSTGPPSIRLHSALKWARLAFTDGSSASLDGYATALHLLPQVAWLGQTVSARHKELVSIGGLGNEAAAAAIEAGNIALALEWLEQGRSVVWSQLLSLRTPVDELCKVDQDLADGIVRVSKALENASTRDNNSANLNREVTMEQVAQQHRQLAQEWDVLIQKARTIPGFEEFLLPRKASTLSKAAQSGPVVVINVYKSRCDALAIIPGVEHVVHIPLECLSYDEATRHQDLLYKLLSSAGVRIQDTRKMRMVSTQPGMKGFDDILSYLWINVVKPILDGLAFNAMVEKDPPRIWWCPTGPLTFLPIHAAGCYTESGPGHIISDFVTSSYTPTLTTLLGLYRNSQVMFQGLLAVAQPCTPGQSMLPNARKELVDIEQADACLQTRSLSAEQATVDSVVAEMKRCSWVHLACHATQDTGEPTQSAFLLHDGRLALSQLITESFPYADFAFLSACQTAAGDSKLSEEAVHLAAGMLSSGYRSVIATMWSIQDVHAPLVASEVYHHLVHNSLLDSTSAAHALHHAVKRLRDQLGDSGCQSFVSWVPYIHVGI